MNVLRTVPLVKQCLELWRTKPPTKSGGIYWSSCTKLQKKGWLPPRTQRADMELLRQHIHYLLDKDLLLTRFQHCYLRALSLMWASDAGTGMHIEDPAVAPAGFAVISLQHFFEKPEDEPASTYTLVLEYNKEYHEVDIEAGDIYSVEGAALKEFRHGTELQEGATGKVALRLSFAYDEKSSDLDTKPKLKASTNICRSLSELEAEQWALFSYDACREYESRITAAAAVTMAQMQEPARKSSRARCVELTTANKQAVAKLIRDPKYYVGKHSKLRENAKFRKDFAADVLDMQELQLDLIGDPTEQPESEPIGEYTAIGGNVYGGPIFSDPNICKEFSKECWEIAKTWPTAHTRFWHDQEANDYMTKMVLHLDGPGLRTTPFPRLVGTIEMDEDMQPIHADKSKKVEKARQQNTVVIDKNGTRLRKTKSKTHKNKSFQKWKDLVDMVRQKLPSSLKRFTTVVYDLTILFSGTVTPDHIDEPEGDGPGHVIVNLCLNGDGILVFSSEADPNALFHGTYMMPNAWIAFTGNLRYAATHQVLRLESRPIKLDFKLRKPRAHDRIIVCIRFGNPPSSDLAQYNILVGDKMKLEEEAVLKDNTIVDLTTELTALKNELSQAAKSSSHWSFEGTPAKLGLNAFTTKSLTLKRSNALVEPWKIFRLQHTETGNRTDHLILAVGWLMVNRKAGSNDDKHFVMWTLKKDADNASWSTGAKQAQLLDARWVMGDPYVQPKFYPAVGQDLEQGQKAWGAYKKFHKSTRLTRPRKKAEFSAINSISEQYCSPALQPQTQPPQPQQFFPPSQELNHIHIPNNTQIATTISSLSSSAFPAPYASTSTSTWNSASPTATPSLVHGELGSICNQMLSQTPGNTMLHMTLASVALETQLTQQRKRSEEISSEASKEADRRAQEAAKVREHELALREKEEKARAEERKRTDDFMANHHELAKMVCSLSFVFVVS